ncbi:MAG TPA: N-acyl homoserine lactonase family protein [Thermoleophilaceae bacterium]
MKIHAIQTGTVAVKQRQPRGEGGDRTRLLRTMLDSRWTEPLPILAWAIEHPEGLIVVDTGETARVNEPGYLPSWHPYFRTNLREWIEPEQEIGPQLRRLGLSPDDARWVVLTHFHTDHAGGMHHFPRSDMLVTRADFEYSSGRRGMVRGFLPQHWPDWFAPTFIEFTDQAIGPFERSLPLTDAGDVVLVPTPGHTPGHVSVAVRTDEAIVLLAGDASYNQALMLEGAIDGVSPDGAAAHDTLRRLQRLAESEPTVYLPAHDHRSAARLAAMEVARARREDSEAATVR